MKDVVSRRSMLAGIGYAAAYGSVASQVLSVARAQEAGAPAPAATAAPATAETVLSMVFMAGPKSKFDTKKYTAKHLPLLKSAYGDSVSRIELRTGSGQAMGIPASILATTSLYVTDLRGFIQKMTASAADINKDLEESSKGTVIVQPDRMVSAVGGPRGEVREGTHVFSTYFADMPGGTGTFDANYYTEVYIPKLMSLYGENAIRRIETNIGMIQGGQKPLHTASSHIFIRDRSAYDSANQGAFSELMKLGTRYTTLRPMWADLRLTAIA
jgi:hypothetical protein